MKSTCDVRSAEIDTGAPAVKFTEVAKGVIAGEGTRVSASIESLLQEAQRQGIKLWLKEDRLHYRLPKDSLELDVFAEIKQRKGEVLAFLRSRRETLPRIPDLQPQVRPSRIPLSFGQRRLWVVEQFGFARAAYNIGSSLRVRGEMDVHAFERALHEIVNRHEALRTRIEAFEGEGYQIIEPPGVFRVDLRDLSAVEAREREYEVRQIIQTEFERTFVLSEAPLFRVILLRLSAREHVLSFVLHHIIADGASMEVLVRELMTLYAAYREGQPSPLEPLSVQYADFVLWQRAWLHGEMIERLLTYWKEHLAGMSPVLDLPTDRPRAPVATFMRAARTPIRLSPSLAASLIELGRRHTASLYMVLLAGLKILLARLSGQNDVTVGSPISERTHARAEGLIGLFVNALVMRTKLSGDPTFAELLARVRDNALGAYVHQALPFERLVAELQPPRDLSRQPLAQVMFTLDVSPERRALSLAGLQMEEIPAAQETARFDLLVTLELNKGVIQGSFEYPADLFDAATIDRYVKWYQQLLEQVAADPQRPLSQLQFLDPGEREQLLLHWNRTQREYSPASVMALIEQRVQANPRAVALVCGEQNVSYAELWQRSSALARYLRALGVGAEVIVGVFIERSVDQIVSLLAILKAGGAYLPLDVTYPAEYLSSILADAHVSLVLTHERYLPGLPHEAMRVVCLDRENLQDTSKDEPDVAVHPEQLAHVICIPGPNRRPLGVCATRENLRFRVAAQQAIASCDADEFCCYRSPMGSASAIYEVLTPLTVGAQLLVLSESASSDPRRLLEEAQDHAVSRWTTGSSLAASLTQSEDLDLDPERLRLRHWTLSGEPLGVDLIQWLARELPDCRFVNLYGATEAGSAATLYVAHGNETDRMPIGRPIGNVQVYVLDEELQPTPVGMPGELYIGGAGLTRGYLDDPRQTAQRFLANPHGPPGSRMYRTGDRARHTVSGELEYLGRRDQQVKLHGYRIELRDVESCLHAHPGVQQAAVVLHKPGAAEAQLVAYYVVAAGVDIPDAATLMEHLRQRLPAHMIPAHFVELEQLPRTSNGDLDRLALPVPSRALQPKEYVAARSPTEQALVRIWEEMFKLERVGIHDNFFDLGGDSIVSIQIIDRAQRVGLHLSLRQTFEHQTIAELSPFVRADVVAQADAVSEQTQA